MRPYYYYKKGGHPIDIAKADLLNFILEHNIIDLSYVQEQILMKEREKFLKSHPYKIWEGQDQKWRTYLPDNNKKRKLIKRKNKADVESIVIAYYKKHIEVLESDFKNVYWKWRSIQDELVSSNTPCKYNTDYKRFFQGTTFETTLMKDITEEVVKVFICNTIRTKKLGKKATKTLFGYINNVIRSARINNIIVQNPMEFLQSKQFYKYCFETQKPQSKKIVSDEEMKMLYQQFYKDYATQPQYIPTYAVEFATLTGFRVSEISALKWDCITDDYIIVDKSEKYDRNSKTYFIGKTKNQKERIFPITTEIHALLKRIKEVAIKYGYYCEWVFANENGRIHAPVISSCTKNKCRQVGITEKGIHAYRKTVNSKMRCNGVSAVVASALMGHTQEVNEEYYTFDIVNFDDKKMVVSQMNEQIKVSSNQR